jgi:hypothetical protein
MKIQIILDRVLIAKINSLFLNNLTQSTKKMFRLPYDKIFYPIDFIVEFIPAIHYNDMNGLTLKVSKKCAN